MSAITSFLSEAELHGLVDGHVEANRRADVLRRAASSDADRARIEAWQEQADMIRAAFRGVDRESVPAALDLQPPARVISLAPVRSPLLERTGAHASAPLMSDVPKSRASAVVVAASTMLVIAGGLAGAWVIAGSTPVVLRTAEASSGTVEDVLAQRTANVLVSGKSSAAQSSPSNAPSGAPVAMPTTSIPDLTSIGFTLSGAEAQPVEPASLVFRYRNTADEQIVIGVARAPLEWRKGLPDVGRDVVVWRVGGKAYAIGGTLRPERLRAIATSLRDEAIEE